jgi:putative addiction module killer protein
VDARPRTIRHYVSADGKDMFDQWMKTLKGNPAFTKATIAISRAEDGNLGDHRAVGEGVWELRINFKLVTVFIMAKTEMN